MEVKVQYGIVIICLSLASIIEGLVYPMKIVGILYALLVGCPVMLITIKFCNYMLRISNLK